MTTLYRPDCRMAQGERKFEYRDEKQLMLEIQMLRGRMEKMIRIVGRLSHPYMVKLSQMLDLRLNQLEQIKKGLDRKD